MMTLFKTTVAITTLTRHPTSACTDPISIRAHTLRADRTRIKDACLVFYLLHYSATNAVSSRFAPAGASDAKQGGTR